MEISMIGENAFPQSVAGIEEKGGNAKNPHFLEYPERSGLSDTGIDGEIRSPM